MVSANNELDAAFYMGQSKEHVLLCTGSGIGNIIVAMINWTSMSRGINDIVLFWPNKKEEMPHSVVCPFKFPASILPAILL